MCAAENVTQWVNARITHRDGPACCVHDPAERSRIADLVSDCIADRFRHGFANTNTDELTDSVAFAHFTSNDRETQRTDRQRDLGAHR